MTDIYSELEQSIREPHVTAITARCSEQNSHEGHQMNEATK